MRLQEEARQAALESTCSGADDPTAVGQLQTASEYISGDEPRHGSESSKASVHSESPTTLRRRLPLSQWQL